MHTTRSIDFKINSNNTLLNKIMEANQIRAACIKIVTTVTIILANSSHGSQIKKSSNNKMQLIRAFKASRIIYIT